MNSIYKVNIKMKKSFPTAAFFDLDDTILGTTACSNECWKLLSEEYTPKIHLKGHVNITSEKIVKAINDFRLWFWSDANRNRSGRLNPEQALFETIKGGLEILGIKDLEMAESMSNKWDDMRWSKLKPLPNAIDALNKFKMAGVKLALITNGNAQIQSRKVQLLELETLMDHVQIEGEFGVGKPDPAAYLNALKILNVSPEETWMAGDNIEFDVIAPMKLGIYGIWVDTNEIGLESQNGLTPDLVVESIAELV